MVHSKLLVLRQARLTDRHKPTGKTHHYHDANQLPAPSSLRIGKYSDDSGYYLVYLDASGVELTDTYHDSIEGALVQAEWEFGIKPDEWAVLHP